MSKFAWFSWCSKKKDLNFINWLYDSQIIHLNESLLSSLNLSFKSSWKIVIKLDINIPLFYQLSVALLSLTFFLVVLLSIILLYSYTYYKMSLISCFCSLVITLLSLSLLPCCHAFMPLYSCPIHLLSLAICCCPVLFIPLSFQLFLIVLVHLSLSSCFYPVVFVPLSLSFYLCLCPFIFKVVMM